MNRKQLRRAELNKYSDVTDIIASANGHSIFLLATRQRVINHYLSGSILAQHTSCVLNFHGVYNHKTSEFLGVFTAQFTYELPLYSQSVTAFCPIFKTTSFLSYYGVLYEANKDTFREDHFRPHSCDLVSIFLTKIRPAIVNFKKIDLVMLYFMTQNKVVPHFPHFLTNSGAIQYKKFSCNVF